MAKSRKRKPGRKPISSLRVCAYAVLLVGVLIGWSYGSTAWERARAKGTDVLTEFSLALEQAELPFSSSETAAVQSAQTARAVQATASLAPVAATPSPALSAPRAALIRPESALPLLVNADHPVADDFAPKDLVYLREACPSEVVSIKGSEIQGERVAVAALIEMLTQARADGLGNWQVSAGYRSVAYQKSLFDDQVYTYRKENNMSREQAIAATMRYVAQPGASEHHTGLAFDITVPNEAFRLTPQSTWLAEHCWDYGFIIRYTEEKEAITGIAAEPWHIRYVGQPHATIMHEQNWCLEEYMQANQNKDP